MGRVMEASDPNLLSTGQAARLCSVTPDTVLKWIKRGRLVGARTAGGHYRIHRRHLEHLMTGPGPGDPAPARPPACNQDGLRCWDFLSDRGAIRDDCHACVVYRVRAARCFLVARLEQDIGHARRFCQGSCDACAYYRRVNGLATNVLFVTADQTLIDCLGQDGDSTITLRIAGNMYEAAVVIEAFRPALAVIDVACLPGGDSGLLDALATDPRVPGLGVILVVPAGMKTRARRRWTSDLIIDVLEKPFGVRRIAGMVNARPDHPMTLPQRGAPPSPDPSAS